MLNNLAQSVADKGDLPRAQELFERVLTLRKAALGLQDAATAQSIVAEESDGEPGEH